MANKVQIARPSMQKISHAVLLIFSIICLTFSQMGKATEKTQRTVTIKGSITYHQRVALPPESIIQLEIKESSKKKIIEKSKIPLQGKQVPIPFSIMISRGLLKSGKKYQLESTIYVQRKPAWKTDPILINSQSFTQDVGTLVANPVIQKMTANAISSKEILGVTWRLEDLSHQGIIDDTSVTLKFDHKGSLSGRSGCNSYSGEYKLEKNSLSILPNLRSTLMACAPAIMTQEQKFTQLLLESTQVKISPDNKLVITTKNGQTLTFIAEK